MINYLYFTVLLTLFTQISGVQALKTTEQALDSLPNEITSQVIGYLDPGSLVNFAATNENNFSLSISYYTNWLEMPNKNEGTIASVIEDVQHLSAIAAVEDQEGLKSLKKELNKLKQSLNFIQAEKVGILSLLQSGAERLTHKRLFNYRVNIKSLDKDDQENSETVHMLLETFKPYDEKYKSSVDAHRIQLLNNDTAKIPQNTSKLLQDVQMSFQHYWQEIEQSEEKTSND